MPNFPRPPALALVSIVLALGLGACGSSDDGVSGPAAVAFQNPTVAFADPLNPIDLKSYTQTGRYSLPVGTGANLLAEEASAVTYNKDTGTLFVVGDGGTSITQVTKKGVLIDSMTLAADATKPQGTYFYDPEGLTYLGGGKFVMVEERFRQVNEFTYAANTTLGAAGVKSVKLGTTIGNIGIEGISFDPMTSGFIAVKESGPSGVFQTSVNFATGTATNASPTTENSTNLFDPAKTGLSALNDVFALSNILASSSADYGNLMILSAPDGKIVKMSRTGELLGTLSVGSAAQNEGMTMDPDGVIYVVSEVGGGPGRPELLVFSPTTSKNAVAIASNLYLTFNQTVVGGTGSLTLSNGAGDTRVIAINDATQVRIRDKTLIIDPTTDLVAGTTYSVSYPAGLLKDALGNSAPAATGASAPSFTATGVVDNAAPTLVSTSPVDEATGITSSRVILTFNEPVVAGNGNIVISNGAGDTRTIPVGDITQVTFSGNTANINPGADLIKGSSYNVQLASGVIKDAAGNSFAGITNATTLNFSMAAAAPTVLAAGDLIFMSANADATDSFAIALLKPVAAGTQIGFSDRDYTAAAGMPATGESAYMWTADVAYPAGTIITVQTNPSPPLVDKGTVQGAGGGLSTSAETIYAFQGTIAGLTGTTGGAITVDRFLAAVNIGTAAGDIPAELITAGAYISFPLDNAKYNGSLDRADLAAFAARVRDFANWVSDDATAYPLTANNLFPGN
jgi:uncharacterized protein YjiK/methionine-rich copper-binding protein CopC